MLGGQTLDHIIIVKWRINKMLLKYVKTGLLLLLKIDLKALKLEIKPINKINQWIRTNTPNLVNLVK